MKLICTLNVSLEENLHHFISILSINFYIKDSVHKYMNILRLHCLYDSFLFHVCVERSVVTTTGAGDTMLMNHLTTLMMMMI